eukprot:g79.t1
MVVFSKAFTLAVVCALAVPRPLATATPAAPPADVPDIFGGSGHGLVSGFGGGCSGELFAFSGLDGPTRSTTNFVAVFENASNYDMRFCLTKSRYVRVRLPPAAGAATVLASTNDVLWADYGAAGAIRLAWTSWDVLAGAVPPGTTVSMDDAAPLAPPASAPSGMECVSAPAAIDNVASAANCSDLAGTWARPGRSGKDDYEVTMQGAGAFAVTSVHPSSWKHANGTVGGSGSGAGAAAVSVSFDNGKHNSGTCAVGAGGATYLHWSDGSTWARDGAGPGPVPSGTPSVVVCSTAAPEAGAVGVAVAYGFSADEALGAAAAAAASATTAGGGVAAAIGARLRWVPGTPRASTPDRQRLLNKAVSVMRVNSLAPEGTITQHWSTPDRVPHKFMWLWDSCYHSMARSVLNDTLGWEFVQSMLSVQAASGAVPIERSPLGLAAGGAGQPLVTELGLGIDTTQTQPPLLAWAIWENYELALAQHGGGGGGGAAPERVLDRLRYSVPRLERYLQWDFVNRGDPTGATPLLYWLKGTESGMDNSQRFDSYNVKRPLLAVDFSVFAAREAAFVSRMHGALGNATAAAHWASVASKISAAVHATLWDADRQFYYDRHTGADGKFSDVAAVSGLLPLWLPDIPPAHAAALMAKLDDEAWFAAPVPLPSVALSTRGFSTDMWRGPMWLNTNWHVVLALLGQNATSAAQRLLGATVDAVGARYKQHGVLFEFYDSRNTTDPTVLMRKGHVSGGVRDYHWTAALTFRMILQLEQLERA